MRNAVIELLLIWICFRIGLADTFCDDFGIAAFMTEVLAVFTLHAGCVLEELSAKSTAHDAVKLLVDELVAVLLLNLLLPLADSAFAPEADIEGSLAPVLLGCRAVSFEMVQGRKFAY